MPTEYHVGYENGYFRPKITKMYKIALILNYLDYFLCANSKGNPYNVSTYRIIINAFLVHNKDFYNLGK